MKAGWKAEKLGDVCELIKRGIAPKYLEEGGLRVVNQKCIRDHSIDYSQARRNDTEKKKVPAERLIKSGDVLVNSTGTGTLGRVAQVRSEPKEKTTVDTHVTIVRPRTGQFYPDFFGYMMINIEDELIAGGHGASGQTELPRTDLEKKFTVYFPTCLEEQQRIVAVLDEAFEGLARARAHAEANLQNARELFESTLGALFARDETASVLTVGALVDAGILEKPMDGNHGEIHPKKADFVDSGVPFIMATDLKGGRVDQVGCHHITREQADSLRKGFAKDGDVLLSHKGTIGRTAILETNHDYVMLTPQVTYYRSISQEKLCIDYLYFAFRSGPFQKQITEAAGAGATRAYIGITKQLDLSLPLPSIEKQVELSNLAAIIETSTDKALVDYEAKLQDLDDLRQSLLQKAFAGELT